jgi:RNA polymerase sigma factor for flagellar operon FliA
VDRSEPEAPAIAVGREISQRLHELVAALPPEAATLIRATYFEGLTLQEAGTRLGVSKSWASRLHARALQRLARSLRLEGITV